MVVDYKQLVQQNVTKSSGQVVSNIQTTSTSTTGNTLQQEINKYVSEKQAEGFKRDPSGDLVKQDGNTTTRIKINDTTGEVEINTQTITPSRTEQRKTNQYESLTKKINSYKRQLRKGVYTSPKDIERVNQRIEQLEETRNNLLYKGTAYYTVEVPAQVTKQDTTKQYIYYGYGTNTPAVSEQAKTLVMARSNNGIPKEYLVAPRTVNQSETKNISDNYNIVLPEKNYSYIRARRKSDFIPQEINKDNVLGVDTAGFQQKYASNYLVDPSTKTFVAYAGANVVSGLAEGGINTAQSVVDIFGKPAPTTSISKNPVVNKALQVGETLNPLNILAVGGEAVEKTTIFVVKPNILTGGEVVRTGARITSELSTQYVAFKLVGGVYKVGKKVTTARPYTKTQVVGGTEQFLKYGDNRINKQFNPQFNKELSPTGQPFLLGEAEQYVLRNFKSGTRQVTLKGKRAVDVEPTKPGKPLTKEQQPPEIQKDLFGKKTMGKTFRDEDLIEVKDATQSTQKGIKVMPELELTETGETKISTGFKLIPLTEEKLFEGTRTTAEKTTSYLERSRQDEIMPGDNVFAREVDFKNLDTFDRSGFQKLTGRKPQTQLILLEEQQAQGKVIRVTDTQQQQAPLNTKLTSEKGTFQLYFYGTQTKTSELQQPKTILNYKQETNTRTATKSVVEQAQEQQTGQTTRTTQIVSPRTATQTIQGTTQQSITSLKLESQQQTKTLQKTIPILRPVTPTKTKLKPFLNYPTTPPSERAQSFVTKVKRKGKFITIGRFKTMGEAFNRGKQFVEQTASATFKIETDTGQTTKSTLLPKGFVPSKTVTGGIVQARGYRIQSQGEKLEITSKGRETLKIRKKIKNLGIFGGKK